MKCEKCNSEMILVRAMSMPRPFKEQWNCSKCEWNCLVGTDGSKAWITDDRRSKWVNVITGEEVPCPEDL
jgi:hypothetical protein